MEAKINQEKLVKSRRKIWSLPLVLVTALLLVGLFGASVLAQSNADPRIKSLDDTEMRLADNAAETAYELDLTEEITDATKVDGAAQFNSIDITVKVPEQLAATVMTSKVTRATVVLSEPYSTGAAPETYMIAGVDHDGLVGTEPVTVTVPSAVAAWWDGLNNAQKIAVLGVNADQNDDDSGDTCDVEFLCTDDDDIVDYENATGTVNPDLEEEGFTAINLRLMITRAFHWDMLNPDEMVAVATAAGLDDDANELTPADYNEFEKAFRGLDQNQRTAIQTLYEAPAYLVRGRATTLTVTHGGTAVDAEGALDEDGEPTGDGIDDRIGEATITVKVSDSEGRLISPPSTDNTVGDAFIVDVQGTKIQQLRLSDVNSDGLDDARLIPPSDDDTHYTIRLSSDAENVAIVELEASDAPANDQGVFTGQEIGPTFDSSRGRLTNGPSLGLSVNPVGIRVGTTDTFTIKLANFDTIQNGSTFTFRAYALNEPVNFVEVDFMIELAEGNRDPAFADDTESAATVSESGKVGDVIYDFDASDPDHTTGIRFSISGEGAGTFFAINSDGELTIKTVLDFQGDDEVDSEDDDDELFDLDEGAQRDNIYELKVKASDDEGFSERDFTITVEDHPDYPRPIGSNQKLPADEGVGTADAEESHIGFAPPIEGAAGETFTIGQQIDNLGNITLLADDILFGIIEDSGSVYLKEGKVLDFESGIITYTLSIKQGGESGIVVITVQDVNEEPKFDEDDHDRYDLENTETDDNEIVLYVLESAAVNSIVKIGKDAGGNPATTNAVFAATDEDTKNEFRGTAYDLFYDADTDDDDEELTDAYAGTLGADKVALFTVDADGAVRVATALDTDADDSESSISLKLRTYDTTEDIPDPIDEDDDRSDELRRELTDDLPIRIEIIDTNVAPVFDDPSRLKTHATVSEGAAVGTTVHTYRATDEDGDVVRYRLRDEDDAPFFTVNEIMVANATTGVMEPIGELNTAAGLDYETQTSHAVEIQAYDTDGDTDEIVITVDVENANDNSPAFNVAPDKTLTVAENTPRGMTLGSYAATDADGDTVTYSLSGTNAKSFHIDGDGNLKTLESLDYDSNTPCSVGGCSVTVVASDANAASGDPVTGHDGPSEAAVTISVLPIEDSVSTLNVTKANPVPGTTRGDPMTALGNTKTSISDAVPERPADLPNKEGAPLNFVETDWANWGTVLRIEVTAQSPDATCDGGNECVIINLNSDSADDTLQVKAYRMDTPPGATSNENKFVAAVMLVEVDGDATDIKTSANVDIPVYKHGDGTVARLQVDEEDEIEVEFGNLRGDIDVENEAPEIGNFAPEHESAFDDPDVEYTFTVTDSHSGLPEPEDLPDPDGDDSYMPVVALISKGQCETADQDASAASKARRAKLINDGFEVVGDMANISDDESLYCPGVEQDGEYDASGAGYGFAPIRDDKDFNEIDDGFDVDTTIVLRENKIFYVTFVACDAAGNCSFYDPDGNDEAEELAEITVDTEDPVFVEARTGLTWDSTGNEYDDNRSYIQVIFNDLTKLNTETVEIDDFVVEGHSIKDVQVYENPDDDDVTWADSGRYGAAGSKNKRGVDRYRDLENVVFIELEDELLADETPDVTIVPNGVEDKAGNEQDDGDHEANDWISPAFTIVSIVSTRETSQDQVLAGDDDEVTVVVTSDERLDSTRPTVLVTYVNAPAGSVDTKGVALCDTKAGADEGTRERGEIVHTGNDDCADSDAAKGGNLNNNVEKVSNTEWIVTITEPKATGYYNFRIEGNDRSPQENPGSEGVSPGAIVMDFFDADGDVNVDDAIFFEGDINLPKPNVRVSGVSVEDNEADVEFRSPLFVELDFAANHSDNCRNVDSDERMSNCMNENSEYAEDNFDDIVVTSFVLDGVDITDSVKTTDNQSFLVSLESISIGDHTAELQAVDQAGNVFEDTLEIDFEVNDRDPFEKRLSPGWNLVSLPGEPADSSIAAVFGPGVEVRTVYTYDPVIPGGWQVAVRETLDSDWQGDLTDINGQRGYWVLSDAIQDWEVSIPRLSGGAAGTGTPIQPPVIPLYAGWNLIPVTDISGNGAGGDTLSADVYLQSLDDGIDLARVLGFDTIRNQWETVLDPDMQMNNTLTIGSGYWIFVREATSLVPSGYVGGGGGD